jgi:osmotically inducible protein OsmC
MPRIERSAEALWDGSVARGEGTISAGAFGPLPFSLAARIGDPGGKTNPEELLAAAHAGCYAMSLAGELVRAGRESAQLSVTATVTLDEVEGGSHRIVASRLLARARVQDMAKDELDRLADAADEGCPFSALIKASGTVTVTAEFEGGANGD